MGWENLRNGFKIKPKLHGDPVYAQYVQDMAKAQREAIPLRPRVQMPEGMVKDSPEYDTWILSMQSKGTQEIMQLHKDPNYKRDWSAPLPEHAQVMDKDGNVDIGERKLNDEEKSIYRQMRGTKKNELGHITDEEMLGNFKKHRDQAITSFMEGGDGILSVSETYGIRDGSINTDPYGPKREEWIEVGLLKAFANWITGKKVRRKDD